MDDLERLAREVHRAPEDTCSGTVMFDGQVCFMAAGIKTASPQIGIDVIKNRRDILIKAGVIKPTLNDCGIDTWLPWNGEGLPPVGTVCLAGSAFWGRVEIMYQGNGMGCYRELESNKEFCYSQIGCKFRPIPTERDIQVNKIENIISRSAASDNNAWAELLYDEGCRIQEGES